MSDAGTPESKPVSFVVHPGAVRVRNEQSAPRWLTDWPILLTASVLAGLAWIVRYLSTPATKADDGVSEASDGGDAAAVPILPTLELHWLDETFKRYPEYPKLANRVETIMLETPRSRVPGRVADEAEHILGQDIPGLSKPVRKALSASEDLSFAEQVLQVRRAIFTALRDAPR